MRWLRSKAAAMAVALAVAPLAGCADGDLPDPLLKAKRFVVGVIETATVKDTITAPEAAVVGHGAVADDRVLRGSIIERVRKLDLGPVSGFRDEALDWVKDVCVKAVLTAEEAAALNAERAKDPSRGALNAAAGDRLWAGDCSALITPAPGSG